MAEAVREIITSTQTVELILDQPFYIPMTGPATRPRRGAGHGNIEGLLDDDFAQLRCKDLGDFACHDGPRRFPGRACQARPPTRRRKLTRRIFRAGSFPA